MSLALEWRESRHPVEREERRFKESKKNEARQAHKGLEKSRKHRLVFTCFLFVAVAISGLLIFSVFLHVMVVQNEMKVRERERLIDIERRQQEEIRAEIASLESPTRIETIAFDELKMVRITRAVYLQTPAFQAARAREREELSNKEAMVSDATQGGSQEDQDMQH